MRAPGYPPSQQDPDGSWKQHLQDGLGSVRATLDDSLTTQEQRSYAPYGEVIEQTGTPQTPFGYTGEMTDPNGLVHLRARYLDPSMGVFLSPDPLEGNPADPMSMNAYAYAHANPVNYTDPSGMASIGIGTRYAPAVANPAIPPVINPGTPDPTAMWHWVNNMNSGCGDIASFPGGAFSPPSTTTQQSSDECISPPTGAATLIEPQVNTSLFSQYGVILTASCGITAEKWEQQGRLNFLLEAINTVDRVLFANTGAGFRNMFGGLEFRLVQRNVGAAAIATSNRLIEISGPDHAIFTNNIIHELGHIAEQRSQYLGSKGMAAIASIPSTERLDDTWIPGRYTLGPGLGAGPNPLLETIADVFMYWVMDSWYNPSSPETEIAKFYIEGTGHSGIEINGQTYVSPGVAFWARGIGQYFTSSYLPLLASYLSNVNQ
ncbi:MAG: RHS repeat-associated core domain-containing protein [Anaerolineae bacterium]|nr:RHS repeat-associated core domain-containing protein [Anaerolineae bacterium]